MLNVTFTLERKFDYPDGALILENLNCFSRKRFWCYAVSDYASINFVNLENPLANNINT